jgi:hypothetical protein
MAFLVLVIEPERARRAERAAAWKRIGRCVPVNETSETVTCTGVRLVSLQLPRSFAACRRIESRTGGTCAVPVNVEAHPHFASAVRRIDAAGLGRHVTEFQTVNRRRCKNAITAQYIGNCVSKHSYGIAADIRPFEDNARWEQVTAAQPGVQRVIDIFRDEGFRWGMNFSNNPDPQHVEWSR